jgi:hypothetical protein
MDLGRIVDGMNVLKAQLRPLALLKEKMVALLLWKRPLHSAALCAALLLGCVFPGRAR